MITKGNCKTASFLNLAPSHEKGLLHPRPWTSRIFSDLIMRLFVLLGVAIGGISVQAGDDRFGFATHFEQGWPPSPVMQAIASSGVSYIRDDLYCASWETSPGVYVQPVVDMNWLNAAKANGLKVVGILGPNKFYADKYDPVAMSNLAAFIAKTGLVTAFEITNEPNNAYATYEGSAWQSKLSALTNAVANAVHAVNPSVQVIGLGAQGTQVFNMLAMGTTMDGVVYHPYSNGNFIPETTYEWQYTDYANWIQVLNSKTTLKGKPNGVLARPQHLPTRVRRHFLPGGSCNPLA